ncbi:MAG: hypothetical protein QM667_13190 [Asticcacaulis sp.]
MVVSLQFDIANTSEQDAFFGAFFKFVEAASLQDADSISIHSDTNDVGMVKVVQFGDQRLADQFESYWMQRRRWLGL